MRHSPIIYTSYKYIRVLFSIVKKEMFRQSIQGTGYMVSCRPA